MKVFWRFVSMMFRVETTYRLDSAMRIFTNMVGMFGAYWLWQTLYRQDPNSFPVSLDQMITYGLLAMMLDSVFHLTTEVRWYITGQMRDGAIQKDLLYPLDFLFHMLARNTGHVVYALVTQGLPGLLIGMLVWGMRLPASAAHGMLFVVSLVLAYLISFSLSFLLGMVSIYTIEATQISWFYFSITQFLSGQFVPLWIFPAPIAQVVRLLPFQGIIGIPVTIYIGASSVAESAASLLLQFFWAAVLLLACRLVWHKAQTKLIVQGG